MSFHGLVSHMLTEELSVNKMIFTIWDVGHGLSIWIKTPNGNNHWIDAGRNSDSDFSPTKHVHEQYGEKELDYLIISHPDRDHIENLPDLIRYLGEPRALDRNQTLPAYMKYGDESSEYQKVYKNLDCRSTHLVPFEESPLNPDCNGGINAEVQSLGYQQGMEGNDTSLVAFYCYAGYLFVCPGDIEPTGWNDLWDKYSTNFQPLIDRATKRILIAPHHGRKSGYSDEMMESINPHLVIVCDKLGGGETDRRFRENPLGLQLNGSLEKFKSTKTSKRFKFIVRETGAMTFNEV
ncbi:MAG: ComEC/Rec2 family competence protein [Candidatus Scalindua sp.]